MIEVRDLEKTYYTKERDFVALKNVNLTFEPGEFVAILGESGSGKTTFLNMISGVDLKTKGEILINEQSVDKFNDAKWRETRNTDIGFIFQRFNLIDHLTVIENVVLPLILTGSDNAISREIAEGLLTEVGLEGIGDKLASELSGGQRQRVAIARTIIINPSIILADEPTGALDSTTAKDILSLIQKFADGRVIIMVTHDEDLAYKNATRVVRLHDGEVISDETIKEKNSTSRDLTNRLLSYETKITKRLRKRLIKQFPYLEEELVVGEKHFVPLNRKYIANNPVFTRKIARENYKQKLKINRRILWSFVISISMLLLVNLVMTNITQYNFNLFDINNNYYQYLVSDYEEDAKVTLLTSFEAEGNIDEASLYYEHYVQEMYLANNSDFLTLETLNSYNKGISSPKMVTLPLNKDNFNLNDQIIAGNYPVADNEIIVSSEFILARFFEYSMVKEDNIDYDGITIDTLNQVVGMSLYVCGETITDVEEISLVVIENNCSEFIISGVLNSYYKGINYVGNIYTPIPGFKDYIEDLRMNKGFTRVDEYYDTYISFYVKDLDTGVDIQALSDQLDVEINNYHLREYQEMQTLEVMLNFMYIAIFVSLIIISGTIDINIVTSSVQTRIKEIGIYSCIGVSKKSIRNMFVFETVETALRIVLYTSLTYLIMALSFKWLYKYVVVDLTVFENVFGSNIMFSYEILDSIYVIGGAVLFLFFSVLIPSFKAANMRAIDALRSG